jgi:hypothetical protein
VEPSDRFDHSVVAPTPTASTDPAFSLLHFCLTTHQPPLRRSAHPFHFRFLPTAAPPTSLAS